MTQPGFWRELNTKTYPSLALQKHLRLSHLPPELLTRHSLFYNTGLPNYMSCFPQECLQIVNRLVPSFTFHKLKWNEWAVLEIQLEFYISKIEVRKQKVQEDKHIFGKINRYSWNQHQNILWLIDWKVRCTHLKW